MNTPDTPDAPTPNTPFAEYSPTARDILTVLAEMPGSTSADVIGLMDEVKPRTVFNTLTTLLSAGVVMRSGTRGAYRYWLTGSDHAPPTAQTRVTYTKDVASRILDLLENMPGASALTILSALPGTSRTSVFNRLAEMCNSGALYRTGTRRCYAYWLPHQGTTAASLVERASLLHDTLEAAGNPASVHSAALVRALTHQAALGSAEDED